MVLSVCFSQDWLQICIQISQVFKRKWNSCKFLRGHGELSSGSFSCYSSLQQWNPENFSPGFFVLSSFEGSVEVQQLQNPRARICMNHICSVWKEQKSIVGSSLLLIKYEKWIKLWVFKERRWKGFEKIYKIDNHFHAQWNLIMSGPFGSMCIVFPVASDNFCFILFQPSAFLDFYS